MHCNDCGGNDDRFDIFVKGMLPLARGDCQNDGASGDDKVIWWYWWEVCGSHDIWGGISNDIIVRGKSMSGAVVKEMMRMRLVWETHRMICNDDRLWWGGSIQAKEVVLIVSMFSI